MPSKENTHHHQYGLYTKTLCQLPTLTQFKICCIGVLTFGSLGTGSNPHPVTDPFSQQGSRYCENMLAANLRAPSLTQCQWTPALCGSTLRCSVAATSALDFTQSYLPPCRPPRCSRCWHTTTNWILSRREPQHLHTLELSLTCAAGLSSHKS